MNSWTWHLFEFILSDYWAIPCLVLWVVKTCLLCLEISAATQLDEATLGISWDLTGTSSTNGSWFFPFLQSCSALPCLIFLYQSFGSSRGSGQAVRAICESFDNRFLSQSVRNLFLSYSYNIFSQSQIPCVFEDSRILFGQACWSWQKRTPSDAVHCRMESILGPFQGTRNHRFPFRTTVKYRSSRIENI